MSSSLSLNKILNGPLEEEIWPQLEIIMYCPDKLVKC